MVDASFASSLAFALPVRSATEATKETNLASLSSLRLSVRL